MGREIKSSHRTFAVLENRVAADKSDQYLLGVGFFFSLLFFSTFCLLFFFLLSRKKLTIFSLDQGTKDQKRLQIHLRKRILHQDLQ